jgi:hypothetical protein
MRETPRDRRTGCAHDNFHHHCLPTRPDGGSRPRGHPRRRPGGHDRTDRGRPDRGRDPGGFETARTEAAGGLGRARVRRRACARRRRAQLHVGRPGPRPAGDRVSPRPRHDHHAGQPGHGVAPGDSRPGHGARDRCPQWRVGRRPSGGSLPVHRPVRRPEPGLPSRPGPGRAGGPHRAGGRPDHDPGPGAAGRAARHRTAACARGRRRGRPHRRHVRGDGCGGRGRSCPGHPPLQRDAAGAPPRPGTDHRPARQRTASTSTTGCCAISSVWPAPTGWSW